MKTLLMAASLAAGAYLFAASPASAAITCWYNDSGQYTGADTADGRYPVGRLTQTGAGGDYAWAYTIDAPDGTTCPRTRPSQ
jgi:hypothetical protein